MMEAWSAASTGVASHRDLESNEKRSLETILKQPLELVLRVKAWEIPRLWVQNEDEMEMMFA